MPPLPVWIGMLGWDHTLLDPREKVERSFGGALAHFAASAAVVGARGRLLSYADTNEWQPVLDCFRQLGLDVSEVLPSDRSIRFYLHYTVDGRFDESGFREELPLSIPDLLPSLRRICASQNTPVHVCPSTPELDMRYLHEALATSSFVSAQMHSYCLKLDRKAYWNLLPRLSLVFMNESEARTLTDELTQSDCLDRLANWAPSTAIVVTGHQRVTGILKGRRYEVTTVPCTVVDPTGAGDSFAGGCLAGWNISGDFRVGLQWGVLCATAKLGDFSSRSLLRLLGAQSVPQ